MMDFRRRLIATVLTLGLVLGAGSCSTPPESTDDAEVAESPGDRSMLEDSDEIPVADSPIYGDPDAPVTIVEFSSMQCPFCARADATLDELAERYPDDVRLVFKHFPLPFQEQSEEASKIMEATRRQDEEAFWQMKTALFERISVFPNRDMEDLGAELIEEMGLDVAEFREDFNDPEVEQIIADDQSLGQSLGVRGTPHFLINGVSVSGAQPIDQFEQVVDRQLQFLEELRADGVSENELYREAIERNLEADDDHTDERVREVLQDDPEVYSIDIRDTDPIKGADEDEALVTVVEFSSFQCPHCARASDTLEQLVDNYPDEVRIVFKHFPLGMQQHSEAASRASVAAYNQGQFWEYYDALYENQRRFGDDLWEELAGDLGLDIDQFTEDFEAQETADIVEQAQADGRSVGVRGTPGFLINGISLSGAQPLAVFERHVDEQIEIAEAIRDEEGLTGDQLHEAVIEYNRQDAGSKPEAEDDSEQVRNHNLEVGDSFTTGADDPELIIYEFSSFQCPFCARAADTIDQIMHEYGDDVQLVYKNFPLPFQADSEPAARAAVAAGQQGQFWEMYEALYDNQNRFGDGLWEELAEEIGLDLTQFRSDFESDVVADQVEAERAQGESAGVQGTPAFFIGDEELRGAQPIDEFRAVIDRQLDDQ